MNIDGTEHITAARAAEELETTVTRILMLVREKSLVGRQVEGEWYVARDSLARGTAAVHDGKAARGCASSCSSGGCGCR